MTPAESAARAWGAEIVRLIKDRENAVYEVRLADGARGALRLHRPGYQTRATIRSELWLTEQIAAQGLPVPRPVPSIKGHPIERCGGRLASLVTWVEGREIGDGGTPLPEDPSRIDGTWRALGRLIAAFHNAADRLSPPGDFERQTWDAEAFLGETPLWGCFWDNPSLTWPERDTLLSARDRARDRFARLIEEGADFGLIHADILRENVLSDGGNLSLIDFDDCGFGFRAYDLATAEVQGLEDPLNPIASTALFEGYTSTRDASAPPLGSVPFFVAMRAFASAGWVISRAPADDPRQRFYAERAIRAAETLV